MIVPPKFPFLTALFVPALGVLPLAALEIRDYDPAAHDRFLDFPANPTKNPDQLDAVYDLTGIGWLSNSPGIEYALISRQHILAATHFSVFINHNEIRFLSADGTVVGRRAASFEVVPDGEQRSDLTLITLNAPIPAGAGVTPLPYLDLDDDADYVGRTLGVTGRYSDPDIRFPVIGRGVIAEIEERSRPANYGNSGVFITRYLRFDDRRNGGISGHCHFQQGDSGSPSYAVPGAGERAALVGVHSLVDAPTKNVIRNFDIFVPHYADALDTLMAPLGYRLRPVHAEPTSLALIPSTATAVLRRAKPLAVDFRLENTGSQVAGNLEVEFRFAPGQTPDTLAAPGWIATPDADQWTLRRATLDPAVEATFSAQWAAAPEAEALNLEILCRGDNAAVQTLSPDIPLAPSFAAWAGDLEAAGPSDDPDGDGLPNLLEYALGGDPESPLRRMADGGPGGPVLSEAGGVITLRHARRTDAFLRGLDYRLEFSADLDDWTIDAPAGLTLSARQHVPAIDGFEIVEAAWPADTRVRFARLRVTIEE